MKIYIKAKPLSKDEKIEKIDDYNFIVFVKAPPVQGRANQAIIKLISEYFGVSISRVTILRGHTSRNKIIEIK